MINVGTILKVIDNSGSKTVLCFKIILGFKKRYAYIGNLIKVSIKKLRTKRRSLSKTKKGEIHIGLVIRTKKSNQNFNGDNLVFFDNSVVLLNKKNKLIGTKIFGLVSRSLRYSKFLKIASLSSGFCH